MYDHPSLEAVGVDGARPQPIPREEWIPVPRGSDFQALPGRIPLGRDPRTGRLRAFDEDEARAASVFLAPAWTRGHLPAWKLRPDAPTLPTYAYATLGFADGGFWTTGVRVDADPRQDPWRFDCDDVSRLSFRKMEALPRNRVAQQLMRCALEYGCRAAQNWVLGRHEAPLPTSVACNAQCVGCISLQPDGEFRASHERLTRRVTPHEIVQVALDHWKHVPDGVVSFGQGCEGEPLLEGEVLVEAVRRLRKITGQGTINLNTNASKPEVVAALAEAGLDSIRVSLNSVRPDVYAAYYAPRHYGFADVERSALEMSRRGRFVSVNYLYFPGVNDTAQELKAFVDFARRVDLDLVQVRNLNIDPDLYARVLPSGTIRQGLGVREWMRRLSEAIPGLAYGYFNPTKELYARHRARRRRAAARAAV